MFMTGLLPYVDSYDLLELQKGRNILIADDITQGLAMRVMVLIREMDEDDDAPIRLLINSKGGDVQAGWTIIDSMNLARCPIHTVCYGEADSIAALIFANGRRGERYMLEHSRLMIHQPWAIPNAWPVKESEFSNMASDIADTRKDIESFLSKISGLPESRVHEMCESDYRMGAEKAIALGFADKVLR